MQSTLHRVSLGHRLHLHQIVKPVLDRRDQHVARALVHGRCPRAERSGTHQALMRVAQHCLETLDLEAGMKDGFAKHGCIVASTVEPVSEFRHTVLFNR